MGPILRFSAREPVLGLLCLDIDVDACQSWRVGRNWQNDQEDGEGGSGVCLQNKNDSCDTTSSNQTDEYTGMVQYVDVGGVLYSVCLPCQSQQH